MADVISGVPQGSVLGPSLFLLYINDIVSNISSTIRLFADDSVLYKEFKCANDVSVLQQDLEKVFSWAEDWKMLFNASKCQHLTITKKRKPHQTAYSVNGHQIERVTSSKYLGVTFTDDLKWGKHIANITGKANSTLGVLRRNLQPCSKTVKDRAYKALVRPKLEYAAAAWNPHTTKDVTSLEAIQRQAARFTTCEYGRTTSVTALLQDLGWDTQEKRRLLAQVSMFHKIHHGVVDIPFPPEVTTTSARTMRTRGHALAYHQIQPRVLAYQYSFFPRMIIVWNQLPASTVSVPSNKAFQESALPVIQDMRALVHQQRL